MMFEHIDGREPAQPWRADELGRVTDALVALSTTLTPSPVSCGSFITRMA